MKTLVIEHGDALAHPNHRSTVAHKVVLVALFLQPVGTVVNRWVGGERIIAIQKNVLRVKELRLVKSQFLAQLLVD